MQRKISNFCSWFTLIVSQYFWKQKKIIMWTIFWAILLVSIILIVLIYTELTEKSSPSVKTQKERLVAPAIAWSASSLRVFKQALSEKTTSESGKIFQVRLGDIFRLEINAQESDQNITIPQYGIDKHIEAWKDGMLEFQANTAWDFNIFCNAEKKPCAFLKVEKVLDKE